MSAHMRERMKTRRVEMMKQRIPEYLRQNYFFNVVDVIFLFKNRIFIEPGVYVSPIHEIWVISNCWNVISLTILHSSIINMSHVIVLNIRLSEVSFLLTLIVGASGCSLSGGWLCPHLLDHPKSLKKQKIHKWSQEILAFQTPLAIQKKGGSIIALPIRSLIHGSYLGLYLHIKKSSHIS